MRSIDVSPRKLYLDFCDIAATASSQNVQMRRATPCYFAFQPHRQSPDLFYNGGEYQYIEDSKLTAQKQGRCKCTHCTSSFSISGWAWNPCTLNVAHGEHKHRLSKKTVRPTFSRNLGSCLVLEASRVTDLFGGGDGGGADFTAAACGSSSSVWSILC